MSFSVGCQLLTTTRLPLIDGHQFLIILDSRFDKIASNSFRRFINDNNHFPCSVWSGRGVQWSHTCTLRRPSVSVIEKSDPNFTLARIDHHHHHHSVGLWIYQFAVFFFSLFLLLLVQNLQCGQFPINWAGGGVQPWLWWPLLNVVPKSCQLNLSLSLLPIGQWEAAGRTNSWRVSGVI